MRKPVFAIREQQSAQSDQRLCYSLFRLYNICSFYMQNSKPQDSLYRGLPQFSASAFRKRLSIYVFSYFPFDFEGRMWDLIVSVPDRCLSFYFL